jgi:hypothetical protein
LTGRGDGHSCHSADDLHGDAGDDLLDPTPRRGLQVAIRDLGVMVVLFLLSCEA